MTQHPPAGPLYEQPRADQPVSRPCRRCGRPIIWAVNPRTGSKVPLDARPSTVFWLTSGRGTDGTPQCEQVDGVRINHFVTCPHAAEVRADQQRKRSAAARR